MTEVKWGNGRRLPDRETVRLGLAVLDEAIASIAREERERLRSNVDSDFVDVANGITSAMTELDKLRGLRMPAYNISWVAPLYLTWYQPRQINLAYSFLVDHGPVSLDRMQVVDLGCGALATQFALAMLAATTDQMEATISVRNIDPSGAMASIGRRLWKRAHEVAQREGATKLDRVMAKMSNRCSMHEAIDECPGVSCDWLTSVHAVYEGVDVTDMLEGAAKRFSPEMILATTATHKREMLAPVRLASYKSGSASHRETVGRFNGLVLRRTTALRETLREWAPFGRDCRYLSKDVEWRIGGTIIRTWEAIR